MAYIGLAYNPEPPDPTHWGILKTLLVGTVLGAILAGLVWLTGPWIPVSHR